MDTNNMRLSGKKKWGCGTCICIVGSWGEMQVSVKVRTKKHTGTTVGLEVDSRLWYWRLRQMTCNLQGPKRLRMSMTLSQPMLTWPAIWFSCKLKLQVFFFFFFLYFPNTLQRPTINLNYYQVLYCGCIQGTFVCIYVQKTAKTNALKRLNKQCINPAT